MEKDAAKLNISLFIILLITAKNGNFIVNATKIVLNTYLHLNFGIVALDLMEWPI